MNHAANGQTYHLMVWKDAMNGFLTINTSHAPPSSHSGIVSVETFCQQHINISDPRDYQTTVTVSLTIGVYYGLWLEMLPFKAKC
uniref:SFRICE_028604 n=1 Tax=Spodoptera frugiperda TaxID=7108 RepID=A0A2H1WPG4_SPOFR